jgi:hypothetical protein
MEYLTSISLENSRATLPFAIRARLPHAPWCRVCLLFSDSEVLSSLKRCLDLQLIDHFLKLIVGFVALRLCVADCFP